MESLFASEHGLLDFAEIGFGILKGAKSLKHVKQVKNFVQQRS